MIETIENMTFEELTSAYVILRDLENKAKVTDQDTLTCYITILKRWVETTHQQKLEDMRKKFLGGRK